MPMEYRLDIVPMEFISPEALSPALDGNPGVDGLWDEADYPALWHQQLGSTLEQEMRVLGQHAVLELTNAQTDVITLADALLGSSTTLSLLKLTKQYASAELANPEALTPRPIAGAIYHLAAARALRSFGVSITSLDRAALHNAWSQIAERQWLDQASRMLLRDAIAA